MGETGIISCSLCDQSHVSVEAIRHCPECEEFFCVDCNRHHGLSKFSKFHSTLSIEDYKELPLFVKSIKSFCDEHSKSYDLFCCDHNLACCIECLSFHKHCSNVVPMKDIIKDVKQSTAVNDVEQTIQDLIGYLQKIQDKLKSDKEDTARLEHTILDQIKATRTEINNYLDRLEQKIITELSKTIEQNTFRIQNLIQDILENEIVISSISKDLEKTKRYASDLQTFWAVKEAEKLLETKENELKSLADTGCFNFVEIKCMEHIKQLIKNVESPFNLQENVVPCQIPFTKKKEIQAQIGAVISSKTINNLNLSLIKKLALSPIKNNVTNGCTMTLDGAYVIVSQYAKINANDSDRVLAIPVIDGPEVIFNSLEKDGYFTAVVIINDSSFAASLNEKKLILIINFHTREIVQTIKCTRFNYCIAYAEDSLFIMHKTRIDCYHLTTKTQENIIKNKNFMVGAYLAVCKDRLYYTDGETCLTCLDMTGNTVWVYQDKNLETLRGVAVDRDGNIYVVGEKSENLLVISSSGLESRQLLSKTDGLNKPCAIHYDMKSNSLLVCNECEVLFLYKIH